METPRQGASAPGSKSESARPAEVAEEVADQARAAAGQVVEEVQRQAAARFAEQVERGAERLGGLSEALQAVGRELRGKDDDALAGLTDRAAEQVERFAGYLRGKDLDEIVYEGERLARRQPALFLGGAFLIGVAAARFLKSSGPRRGSQDYRDYGGYGTWDRPAPRYMSRDYGYDAGRYDLPRTGAVGQSGASAAAPRAPGYPTTPPVTPTTPAAGTPSTPRSSSGSTSAGGTTSGSTGTAPASGTSSPAPVNPTPPSAPTTPPRTPASSGGTGGSTGPGSRSTGV
jgi:hypothetical protein